jgi:predicted phage terminase large subunit-like protein
VLDDLTLIRSLLRADLTGFIEKSFYTVCPGEPFQPNWHIEALAWHLREAAEGRMPRLIINLPPRSLKSICTSVAYPAWLLGRDPTRRIICVSYSEDLARKHSRDCRTVLEAEWYRRTFPHTRINPRKNTETEFLTTQQGGRLACSIGGTLTGRGSNTIIIDDPIKPSDIGSEAERRRVNEWYDTTLFSRLDSKESGVIVLVMQRLHQDDLTGHLIEKGGFHVLGLPAMATEPREYPIGEGTIYRRQAGEPLHDKRESTATLEQIKTSVGSRIFAAQYQQTPVPAEGNLFKAEWLRRYRTAPSHEFTQIVQSWDTAGTMSERADYSVCTTWGVARSDYYLLDVLRGRWEFPALLRRVQEHAGAYGAHRIVIEDAGSGAALIQSLRQTGNCAVLANKPKLDKETRAAQQSAQLEAGRVHIPQEASWLAEFEHEILAFPNGRHDDQVDSLVQFLHWVNDHASAWVGMIKLRGF